MKKHTKTDDQEIKRKLQLILKDGPDQEGGSSFVKKGEREEAEKCKREEAWIRYPQRRLQGVPDRISHCDVCATSYQDVLSRLPNQDISETSSRRLEKSSLGRLLSTGRLLSSNWASWQGRGRSLSGSSL